MNRIYIQLGKIGDILNVLPILWADAQAGQRATLMVHRQFADVLDGVGYCDRLIWEGDPNDINAALAEAQKHSADVRCCQIVGDPQAVKQLYERSGTPGAATDSFQKESWRVAGRLALWREQPPLVFDRRDSEREKLFLGKLGSARKKYLLLALESKTSPFPYAPLLKELIRLKFKTGFIVIDLAECRTERIYDLLALYEKAWALIAVDSALLQLAKACPTLPVVALTQDQPSLWHGSAWRPQFISYIRYQDFPKRAVEMLSALGNVHAPGSFFTQRNGSPVIVHVYPDYDRDPNAPAEASWQEEYLQGPWIHTPAECGVFGWDSQRRLKDDKRVPFLKDVIRLGSMRARSGDVICLTQRDTCLKRGLGSRLLENAPCFARREVLTPERTEGALRFQTSYHPAVDLFAFTKAWWQEHQKEVPDFVMGKDFHWNRVFMELMKSHGGKEMKEAVWRWQQP